MRRRQLFIFFFFGQVLIFGCGIFIVYKIRQLEVPNTRVTHVYTQNNLREVNSITAMRHRQQNPKTNTEGTTSPQTTLRATSPSVVLQQRIEPVHQQQQQRHHADTVSENFVEDKYLDRFRKRRAHVKAVCDAIGLPSYPDCVDIEVRHNLRHVQEKDLVFCTIEKTGSTLWKRILQIVGGFVNASNPTDIKTEDADLLSKNNQRFVNSSWSDIEDTLRQTTNIMFVRDPFTRLFSGWLDKFYSTNPYYWASFGRHAVANVRPNATEHDLKCGHDVTFTEFLSYLGIAYDVNKCIDTHFTPSYQHCLPCNTSFEYIGKYETFKEDTLYLIEHLGLKDKLQFTHFEKDSTSDAIYDAANWVFSIKNELEPCISFQCGLFRVWRRLQGRSILAIEDEFPYTTSERANDLTKDEFLQTLLNTAERSKNSNKKDNRKLALKQAYASVPRMLRKKIVRMFRLDFALFGYPTNPDFLRSSTGGSGFSFVQQCPYDNNHNTYSEPQ